MKKYTITLLSTLFLLLFGATSCDDTFRDLSVNPNRVALTSYFQTATDANAAAIGIYGYITTARSLGVNGSGIYLFRGDEFSNRHDYGWPGQHMISSSWYTVVQPWRYMYTAIHAANNVLNNVPNIEMDATEKNAILGEARFWRGFCHWYLLTNYGNIILVPEDANPAEQFSQAAPSAVWDLIISELQQAQNLLPTKDYWTGSNVGRVTKGGATALLGKSYLYRAGLENNNGDYALAAAEFKKIIDGTVGNYSLVANYDDNFTHVNENNEESLFELQFRDSDPSNRGFNPGASNSGTFGPAARGLAPPGFGQFGDAESVTNDWLLEEFISSVDANGNVDSRVFGTLIFNDVEMATNGTISIPAGFGVTGYQGLTFAEMYDGSTTGRTYPFVRQDNKEFFAANRKWLNLNLSKEEDLRKSGVNLRMIRYADVLLMYAEALLMSGGSNSDALASVNQVRARVNMPALAGSLTMEQVKKERILELSCEGVRFYDLLRWGELASVMQSREREYANFKGWGTYIPFQANKHEYLPISIEELDSNPNVVQNTGW